MKTAEFSECIEEVISDLRTGREDIASTYLYTVLVDRLTDEVRETLGTSAELEPDEAFENLFSETEMEMVIALADQTGADVKYVTETVERFMTAHVRPEKESIIDHVDANLSMPSDDSATSSGSQPDNDTRV